MNISFKKIDMFDKRKYKNTKFLSAADLNGQRTPAVTADFFEEVFDGVPAPFLGLRGMKSIRLNENRQNFMLEQFGPDEREWASRRVVLVPGTTWFKGKPVDTIFFELPPQRELELTAGVNKNSDTPD